jgi:hypothetical protein
MTRRRHTPPATSATSYTTCWDANTADQAPGSGVRAGPRPATCRWRATSWTMVIRAFAFNRILHAGVSERESGASAEPSPLRGG